MQVTGMLHGAALLRHVGFPAPEILGPDASEAAIQSLIARTAPYSLTLSSRAELAKRAKRALSDALQP